MTDSAGIAATSRIGLEVNLPYTGLGLGVRDVDGVVREIDVANVDPTELSVAQPGTGEAGDLAAARARSGRSGSVRRPAVVIPMA
jgi:hypothetical protein